MNENRDDWDFWGPWLYWLDKPYNFDIIQNPYSVALDSLYMDDGSSECPQCGREFTINDMVLEVYWESGATDNGDYEEWDFIHKCRDCGLIIREKDGI